MENGKFGGHKIAIAAAKNYDDGLMVYLNSVYYLFKILVQGKVVQISIILFLPLAFLFPSLLEDHG